MSIAAPSKAAGGGTGHSRTDPVQRSMESKKSRLAPLWPEWDEAEINAESWDVGSGKKKDAGASKARNDTKSAASTGTHGFEDPEGKVELPSSFKVEQWKRPVDFLPPERPPVIVDPEHGMENFDIVTPNEHLHFNETMRNIISQINALWDICRRDRKSANTTTENIIDLNLAVMSGRTWRPWEHIYALNKVSRQPFITPYNPSGKYVVRLFFLGNWRKVVIDDTIPFDTKNRCLLPQTSLSYELWPMLLSKALLKILSLDFRSPSTFPEFNETSVIHSLTGWLPEPIPLKYTHAKKVWEFLRYDRSNRVVSATDSAANKSEQQPTSPLPNFGPVPLFKWPDSKIDPSDESVSVNANDQSSHQDDSGTESTGKKSDEKSAKKGGTSTNTSAPKDTGTKSATGKENRTAAANPGAGKENKKQGGAGKGAVEDPGAVIDDQTVPEGPKMVVFGTISHLQPTRLSSYGETADRSERLRRYTLNDTFSTSMLLTSIRDIPLEPPPPPEYVPSWKLVRPRKPKTLPHAEPITVQPPKPDRWVEITSPYINYPTASALNMNVHTPGHITISRLSHSATHSTVADVPDIVEVDEDGDIENIEPKPDVDREHVQGHTSPNSLRKNESPTQNKELASNEQNETYDESVRGSGAKTKREKSADKNKSNRKLTSSKLDVPGSKAPSDAVSAKSKVGESEQNVVAAADGQPTGNSGEQQDSQSKTNDLGSNPVVNQPLKKAYITPKIWMDFDDFCACFTSIVVFHNPRGYQYQHKPNESKSLAPQQSAAASVAKEKKKEANPPPTQQPPSLQDEKSPLYLFVDSPREAMDKNIELIIGLTSLSRWYDSGANEHVGTTTATAGGGDRAGRATMADKMAGDGGSARGLGSRQRTSAFEIPPQTPGANITLTDASIGEMSQKELVPQPGSLIAEIYSWKSLSMGQPILRLHTTATKAALLTLPPGRHVLKFTVTCPIASHLQIMSDTNDFTFGNDDQLLSKVVSVPEDAEFIAQAEVLFNALDDAVQNFNNMDQQFTKLNELFRLYCNYAPQSANLTVNVCWSAFNEALYSTLRTLLVSSDQTLSADTPFAWRCFTNDLKTPDIIGFYESKRPSTAGTSRNSARAGNAPATAGTSTAGTGAAGAGKKVAGGKDKGGDDKTTSKQQPQAASSTTVTDIQEEPISDWLTRELSATEIGAITNVQKIVRGFLQRRIILARMPGTEKNLLTQRLLQSTMTILKTDTNKSASLLFRNLMVTNPQLIECFQFRNDDWNMVTYRDYQGQYQEQQANTWFALFREIFYATEDSFVSAKLLAHAQNSLLRVINNDTYAEIPIVFNRLSPSMLKKNKFGYTFFAEGLSSDQPLPTGRFRLRLLTSYNHLPEPRIDPITSAFLIKEIKDYYVPNKQQIICRYRVIVADDVNQTGRNFHLASIQFTTSKPDVLMRLAVLNNNQEIVSVEGKGSVVLPAFLFMRDVTNPSNATVQAQAQQQTAAAASTAAQSTSRPTSKTGGKKDTGKAPASNTHRGSIVEAPGTANSRPDREKTGSGKRSSADKNKQQQRSSSRTGLPTDEEEKIHKYIIQVTVLRKSWPLTPSQWQFVEQLKEQEKNDLKIFNRQQSPTKGDGAASGASGTGAGSKRAGQTTGAAGGAAKGKGATAGASTSKTGTSTGGRPGTGKGAAEKSIDATKPHWFLRIVSDADKADEITVKKDTERNEELINMKKAWESVEAGRAQKAMKTRQKFLESLQPKSEERPTSGSTDGTGKRSESRVGDDGTTTSTGASTTEQQQQQHQQASKQTAGTTSATKKSASSTGNKKAAAKDEAAKQAEATPPQEPIPPIPVADEPLLDQPPPSKPKIILPPLDIKPFSKHKLASDEPIILDPVFEQEELCRRQNDFYQYKKYVDEVQQIREEDHNNRYKEKIRQLEEYVDLQAKIDQSRRTINEPREAFRQRFLEVERKRLAELAAQEQELIAAAEKAKAAAAPAKGKGSAGKKGKK